MSDNIRPFVIARRWRLDEPFDPVKNCCIYTYGGEIQHGTPERAENFLAYVKRQSNENTDAEREDYAIRWLEFSDAA